MYYYYYYYSSKSLSPLSWSDYIFKYLLVTSNLLFTLLGLVTLVVGLWGLINKESFAQEKISSIGTDPMLLFCFLGLVLALLSLMGCVGALRENMCLLQIFSACCGADTYRDWEINVYFNCSAPGVQACGVPPSCCIDPLENGTVWNTQCGVGAQQLDEFSAQSVIFLGGCLGSIWRWIEQHSGVIVTVVIIVLGVQILTLFITARLGSSWLKVQYLRHFNRNL
uniref:Tetraspanin n=1 Tax=Cyprinus carpio TaxID=7962 RepID=A0A8C2PVE1_CYPCA